MKLDALIRAAQILREQPAATMPLSRLHACLIREVGPEAGTYAQMCVELKKRPHSFMVLESPRLIEDLNYGAMLEEAGLDACTWVSLAESYAEDASDALGMAGSTMTELWSRTEEDPSMREYLLAAARQIESLGAAMEGS